MLLALVYLSTWQSMDWNETMRQNEKDLISAYIYNNYVRLEDHVNTLQNNIRFRKIDVIDCVELICAIQEFETFKEVTGHIRVLLKINEKD